MKQSVLSSRQASVTFCCAPVASAFRAVVADPEGPHRHGEHVRAAGQARHRAGRPRRPAAAHHCRCNICSISAGSRTGERLFHVYDCTSKGPHSKRIGSTLFLHALNPTHVPLHQRTQEVLEASSPPGCEESTRCRTMDASAMTSALCRSRPFIAGHRGKPGHDPDAFWTLTSAAMQARFFTPVQRSRRIEYTSGTTRFAGRGSSEDYGVAALQAPSSLTTCAIATTVACRC